MIRAAQVDITEGQTSLKTIDAFKGGPVLILKYSLKK